MGVLVPARRLAPFDDTRDRRGRTHRAPPVHFGLGLTSGVVRELSAAGRLAAWGGAAIAGSVSPDEAADRVSGPHDPPHRMLGLPGETEPVNLAYALARLRALGATGLRLVLPRPGDATGLPGPPSFNESAIGRGEAVLTVGGPPLGLLPEGRGTWTIHRVHQVHEDRRTQVTVHEAERALTATTRECATLLERLDVARWEPATAEVLAARSRAAVLELPLSVDPRAHTLLQNGLRIAAVVDLARSSHGNAVTAVEIAARAGILRDLDTAARRAIESACSASGTASD